MKSPQNGNIVRIVDIMFPTNRLVTMNGRCNHTWKEIEDQSTKEDFTRVKCLKCGIFGELDNQNNEITITS